MNNTGMSIPLHIVTGFLGSGKTTFVNHYLDTFTQKRKIGVIQNEFSSSNVDSVIVGQNKGAYRMMEVNNGSVFCVCLLGGFIDSLASFVKDNAPDEIIMEVSGLSDPVSIGEIFQAKALRDNVYMGNIWTIVDAKNFNKFLPIRSRLEHQIRIADTVVINKCDLAETCFESLESEVKKINPFAKILRSLFARIKFDDNKNAFKIFPGHSTNMSTRPDIQSLVIKSSRIITLENLKRFIHSCKSSFIRCKGFVNIGKEQKILVQGVFDDYSFEEVEWFPRITELVAIGSFGETVDFTKKFEIFCDND